MDNNDMVKMDVLIKKLYDTIPEWETAAQTEEDEVLRMENDEDCQENENCDLEEKNESRKDFVSASVDIVETARLLKNLWSEKKLDKFSDELQNLWGYLCKANEYCDFDVVPLHCGVIDPTFHLFAEIKELSNKMLAENENARQ